MVSTDRSIFREGSPARIRMAEYASLVERLDIIVFAKRSLHFKPTVIASNATAYPTNSFFRFMYPVGAYSLAEKIVDPELLQYSNMLVTTQDPFETGIVGYFIAKKWRAPLHLQIHTDLLNKEFGRSSSLNSIRVLIAKYLLKKHADIRVVSERVKRSILSSFHFPIQPRITVLPVYVDVEKYQNLPRGDMLVQKYPNFNLRLLMVCRLEKEKNVDLAIGLIARTAKMRPDPAAALVIVGAGKELSRLKRLAKKLDVSDRVFFEGWVDDLAPYYASADLLLSMSSYEGYGMVFVEAAAAGCPVLTTDVGAAGQILTDWNGIICQQNDIKCFLNPIIQFASGYSERKRLSDFARSAAERMKFETKEEYLAQYKKMWEEAAKNRDLK